MNKLTDKPIYDLLHLLDLLNLKEPKHLLDAYGYLPVSHPLYSILTKRGWKP